MSMKEIYIEFKELSPNGVQKHLANSQLEADIQAANERGDKNAVFYISDYVVEELKAELAKHPSIYDYEEMHENQQNNQSCLK